MYTGLPCPLVLDSIPVGAGGRGHLERVLDRLRSGVSRPRLIAPFVGRHLGVVLSLAARSRYRLASLYALDLVTGGDRYRRRLESRPEERYLQRRVLDFRMWLDLLDRGIARDLLVDGVREPAATARYRAELSRLEAERGGLTVVDVGSNAGYFALQYPARMRDPGRVIAIEPVPESFSLLERNVRLNGFEDPVRCYRRAIGSQSANARMKTAPQSNLSTLGDHVGEGSYVGEIDVEVSRLDEFLAENGIPYESVDVVRMDVQGYEYEILRGMRELLAVGDVGLLFVEVHPWYLQPKGQYDAFITALQEYGFELVFAADGRTASLHEDKPFYADRELDIDSLEALREVEFTTELILRGPRNASRDGRDDTPVSSRTVD